jgi:hypothetical protein
MSKPLSRPMFETLRAIAAHEDAGRIGALREWYPARTIVALAMRGLIEPNVDGSRRLTSAGWKAIGREVPA